MMPYTTANTPSLDADAADPADETAALDSYVAAKLDAWEGALAESGEDTPGGD